MIDDVTLLARALWTADQNYKGDDTDEFECEMDEEDDEDEDEGEGDSWDDLDEDEQEYWMFLAVECIDAVRK